MRIAVINRKNLSLVCISILGVVLLLLLGQVYFSVKAAPTGFQADMPIASIETDNIPVVGEVRFNIAEDVLNEKTTANNTDFYVEYRIERERTRGQRVEWLREVINSANSDTETRQKAQDNLLEISGCMEKEVIMENLIKAKGYADAAVLIDNMSVTVVVATDILHPEETVSLAELIARGTGVDTGNIIIITKL